MPTIASFTAGEVAVAGRCFEDFDSVGVIGPVNFPAIPPLASRCVD